ncbi:MAG: FAD-binding oxidoreductase [Rhodospirillales bacterium]|nr:FAD-binding oxidoreductase [Rhodospirillales bacterium]
MDRALDELKEAVGPEGWLASPLDTEPYVQDWRRRWPGRTDLVLRPSSTEQVARIMAICSRERIPVVPQAGNTGLVGGSGPGEDGREVVLSLNRMTAIRAVDPVNNTITVEAGCILAEVQQAAAEADRLYPLSLSAEGSCRIGGNLSTNAGGTNVLRYGNARDHVLGLEVVLADGRVWDGLRGLRKDNTGYDLKQLFLGSEGTLGIITAAVLKLWPRPRQSVTAWLGVPDARAAIGVLQRAQAATGGQVSGFEYMVAEALALTFANLPVHRSPLAADHPACVLLEASSGQADDGLRTAIEEILADAIEDGLVADAVVAESEGQARALWRIREEIPQAQAIQGGGLKHDVAVPVSRVAEFLERASETVAAMVPEARIVAFGHLGDGNLHFNQCAHDADGLAALLGKERAVNDAVESLAVGMGGSFSAEHGIGRLRLRQMAAYKSSVERDLMIAVKDALDPCHLLNPGKVVAFDEA